MDVLGTTDNGCEFGVIVDPEEGFGSYADSPPDEILEMAREHFGDQLFEWTGTSASNPGGTDRFKYLFIASPSSG